ncbi:N-acetyl-gamma-glutamyl-phosphate reductase [Tepidamorphus gemmatus]|jgi:N-acetyl-gamma-glutamyl-phosphate reductase|uniref:N-acetyl-gamma-glutamyl-phosphate reductase n=1 Tax=Tepidamorphus gemmatus TaxID=747076 RepID=A0A4R3MDF5_9HYPH|nr:N-acetyl-gamma-glutamyl-phosphate reductase [Tepidamorphus gemmatus]TCT11456.1 N-acetyl-gamma-glutamyl-phosphate reductase [Tepidamorphus gemmatus]
MTTTRVAILGASGYTGAELVRLLSRHPNMEIAALTADRKAGQSMADVFPHLAILDLPPLTAIDEVDWNGVDAVFCALPHATTQKVIAGLPKRLKIVDLSADFRLEDPAAYEKWYGHAHAERELQKEVVYGLPEFYREKVKSARIVANTGCYVAAAIIPLIPVLEAGLADPDWIIIDAKSGVSGAGRAAKEANLFTEVSEGFHAYSVAGHRHMGEIDQELSKAAGRPVTASFTPHLLPQNRGILATTYLKGEAQAIHARLAERFAGEPFVHVLPFGRTPATRHVRGSNHCLIGVVADRQPGRTILISVLDNLVKGASGQAIQNMNLMLGLPETAGLEQLALFP